MFVREIHNPTLPNIFDSFTRVDFSCVVPGGGVDKKWVSDQVSVGVVGLGHVGGGCIELGIHGGSEGFGHNIQSKKIG